MDQFSSSALLLTENESSRYLSYLWVRAFYSTSKTHKGPGKACCLLCGRGGPAGNTWVARLGLTLMPAEPGETRLGFSALLQLESSRARTLSPIRMTLLLLLFLTALPESELYLHFPHVSAQTVGSRGSQVTAWVGHAPVAHSSACSEHMSYRKTSRLPSGGSENPSPPLVAADFTHRL